MENLEHINIDGVEYFRFYCYDPKLADNTADIKPHFCKHNKCGGDIYIAENAHFLCKGCGETWPIKYSEFIAPSASSNINYFYISPSKVELYPTELIRLVGLMTDCSGLPWLLRFLRNLNEPPKSI